MEKKKRAVQDAERSGWLHDAAQHRPIWHSSCLGPPSPLQYKSLKAEHFNVKYCHTQCNSTMGFSTVSLVVYIRVRGLAYFVTTSATV